MRYIAKQGWGSGELSRENLQPPQTQNEAGKRWKRFGSHNKQALLPFLLNEQYYLCCYGELRADLRGFGYHIEHVENKSQQPGRTFDYQNLAASALDSENGLHQFGINAFGGHAQGKNKSVDMAKFIHCHLPDCSHYFAYVSDGRVVPAEGLSVQEKERAQYTIDLLNLNCGFLQTERRNHWDELERLFDEHIQKDWDLHQLIQLELVPTDGKLNEFFSLTRQFFKQDAEWVLQQHAPDVM